MAEWDAEIVVGPELARELIRGQFTGIGTTLEPFGSGWDNTAYRVDGELIFRFPRREVAVRLMETEMRVLPRLAPHLPLPIPVPEWIGAATERFPWPFAGYRMLPGRPIPYVELSPMDLRAAAVSLAGFLRALHAIPLDGLELPPDEHQRTDFTLRLQKLAASVRALEDAGIVADGLPWLTPFTKGFPAPSPTVVPVHGDLYEMHVLMDDHHRASGVIDWGDVHAGDPALDLSLVYRLFPPRFRTEFWRVYGAVDARTERMARLRATFHAVMVTHYAHSVGNAALLRTARAAMDQVLEE
jgi:aminoglycoside phosphotransferase (APT) family kinase protein